MSPEVLSGRREKGDVLLETGPEGKFDRVRCAASSGMPKGAIDSESSREPFGKPLITGNPTGAVSR